MASSRKTTLTWMVAQPLFLAAPTDGNAGPLKVGPDIGSPLSSRAAPLGVSARRKDATSPTPDPRVSPTSMPHRVTHAKVTSNDKGPGRSLPLRPPCESRAACSAGLRDSRSVGFITPTARVASARRRGGLHDGDQCVRVGGRAHLLSCARTERIAAPKSQTPGRALLPRRSAGCRIRRPSPAASRPPSCCSARRRWCPRSATRSPPSPSCRSSCTASSSSTSSATPSAAFGAAASSSPSTRPRRSTTASRPSAAPSTAGMAVGCLGLAPQFSGSTNVGRVWSIVMKFASWGSELRDALIALYEVSLSWES